MQFTEKHQKVPNCIIGIWCVFILQKTNFKNLIIVSFEASLLRLENLINIWFFFSSKGVFPKIWGHTTRSIGSIPTTLFFLQMSQIPERSRSKTSTALTVSTCFTLNHLRRPPQQYVSTLSYLLRTL